MQRTKSGRPAPANRAVVLQNVGSEEREFFATKPTLTLLMRRAFTLLELLTVVAIVGILAGIIMPVLAQAKRAAKAARCSGNLRGAITATTLYLADYEDTYPMAISPYLRTIVCSFNFDYINRSGICQAPSPEAVLRPYISSPELWNCPLDTGFDVEDYYMDTTPQRPSSYIATGSSYAYNDDLVFWRRHTSTSLANPSKSVVFYTRAGAWHGSGKSMRVVAYDETMGELYRGYRYNSVHADGHVRKLGARALNFGLGAPSCENCRSREAWAPYW